MYYIRRVFSISFLEINAHGPPAKRAGLPAEALAEAGQVFVRFVNFVNNKLGQEKIFNFIERPDMFKTAESRVDIRMRLGGGGVLEQARGMTIAFQ